MMFLRPVEIFGDIAVLAGTSYPCTVVALENLKVWAIDSVTLLNLVSRQPELAQALIRHLVERILYFIDLVEDLTLCSVETRLITTLMKDGTLLLFQKKIKETPHLTASGLTSLPLAADSSAIRHIRLNPFPRHKSG
jgi:CRP-like cAMP-binding protein